MPGTFPPAHVRSGIYAGLTWCVVRAVECGVWVGGPDEAREGRLKGRHRGASTRLVVYVGCAIVASLVATCRRTSHYSWRGHEVQFAPGGVSYFVYSRRKF